MSLSSIYSPRAARSVALAVLVAGGFQLGAAATAKQAEAQMTLQVASVFPESDFSTGIVKYWMEQVTERTDGEIDFRAHWSGSLVGGRMLDGMRDGVVDVALSFTPYVSGEIIDLAVLDVPFSWPMDRDGLLQFHMDVLPIVDEIYQQNGGSRVVSAPPALLPDPVTCNDRFVKDEESWEGVLIRTAGRWQAETISLWGGSPVVLSMADVYTGLDRGTVNCALMVYNGVESLKLYEPAKYVTRVDHSIAFASINVSELAWERLSEEQQQIMQEAGVDAMEWAADQFQESYEAVVANLADLGAELCVPDEAEFERLVAAADGVIENSIEGNTSEAGTRLLELVKDYRPQVTAQPTTGDLTPCP